MKDAKMLIAALTALGVTGTAIALAGATSPVGHDAAIVVPQDEVPGKLPSKQRITAVTRDFMPFNMRGGHPDFEQYNTGLRLGLVKSTLDEAGKPVLAHSNGSQVSQSYRDAAGRPIYPGAFDTSRGDTLGVISAARDKAITSTDSFAQWYRDIPGVNMSKALEITLEKDPASNRYIFDSDIAEPWKSRGGFFPWDMDGFGNYVDTGHNFHFTTEIDTEFVFEKGKGHIFTFTGDDDVWVFVDGQLVIDLSGVHGKAAQTIELDRLSWLEDGQVYSLKIFHAERHTWKSNFRIETTLRLRSVRLPNTYQAYD